MRATYVLVLAIVLAGSAASAEKVKTNQSAKVFARPGEQSKVLVKVKSGQNMTLLAQDGRWLKVRVKGLTGYVPRSKVDMADSGDEIVRNTRRRAFVDGRSTRRSFGGASPDDRIGQDATGAGTDDSGDSSGDDSGDDKPDKPAKTKPPKKKPAKPDKADKADKSDDDSSSSDDDDSSGGDSVKVNDDDKSGDDASSDEPARPTARVAEKTKTYSEPDKDSEEAFVAKPTMVLYPAETKGKWTRVETDDGDTGWLRTSEIEVDEGGGPGGKRKRELDITARLGVTFMQQGMRGGTAFPDYYNLGTSAATVSLGGGVLLPYGKQALLGGELTYDFAKAVPGVHYMTQDIGVTLHKIDIRGVAGYQLNPKSGMTIFGRLGYRYQGFIVDGNSPYNPMVNTAKIPSEVLTGVTIGGALGIPRLTDKIGLKVAVDAMLVGVGLTQTKALEDGSSPSAKVYCLGGVFTYKWKSSLDLQGTYDLNYAAYDFGKPLATSMRGHTAMDVQRTDIFHTVTFGIAAGF